MLHLRLSAAHGPTIHLGKVNGWLGCWLEFAREIDGESIPDFVMNDFKSIIQNGFTQCNREGIKLRRAYTLLRENGHVHTNVWDLNEVDLTGIGINVWVHYMKEAQQETFSQESQAWLRSHRSRCVVQRYGQDHIISSKEDVEKYCRGVISALSVCHIHEVSVAFAFTLFGVNSESPDSPLTLTLLHDASWIPAAADLYKSFFMPGVIRMQAPGVPAEWWDSLEESIGVEWNVTSMQVYNDFVRLTRPTDYEEPFKNGLLTKAVTSKNRLSESEYQQLLNFHDIEPKLEYLQEQPGGLRVELELTLDVSVADLRDCNQVVEAFGDIHDSIFPFAQGENNELLLFGESVGASVIAFKSRDLFGYVRKLLTHLTSPIKRILQQSRIQRLSCDQMEIVAIFERLLKQFLSGSARSVGAAMRKFKIPHNINTYHLPFINSSFINLETQTVSWRFLQRQDGNFDNSYTSMLKPEEVNFHNLLLRVSHDFSSTLGRTSTDDPSDERVRNEIQRLIQRLMDFVALETKTKILKHFRDKAVGCEHYERVYQQLGGLQPNDFLGNQTAESLRLFPAIYSVRQQRLNVKNFINQLIYDDDNFKNFQFKEVVKLLRQFLAMYGAEKMHVMKAMYRTIVQMDIRWFVVPLTRVSLKNLTLLDIPAYETFLQQIEEDRSAEYTVRARNQRAPVHHPTPTASPSRVDIVVTPRSATEQSEAAAAQHSHVGDDRAGMGQPVPGENRPPVEFNQPVQGLPPITPATTFAAFSSLRNSLEAAINSVNARCTSQITLDRVLNELDLERPSMLYIVLAAELVRRFRVVATQRQPQTIAGPALLHAVLTIMHHTDNSWDEQLHQFSDNRGTAFQNYKIGKKFLHQIELITRVRGGELNTNKLGQLNVQTMRNLHQLPVAQQLAFFKMQQLP